MAVPLLLCLPGIIGLLLYGQGLKSLQQDTGHQNNAMGPTSMERDVSLSSWC